MIKSPKNLSKKSIALSNKLRQSAQNSRLKKVNFSKYTSTIIVGLIAGIIGGLVAIYTVNDYFSLTRDRSRQVVLEESSAIIDVANKIGPSVVSIQTERNRVNFFGQSVNESSAASGIVITADGLILTNKHVIPENTDKITVLTSDNQEFKNAKVLARDPLNDIAYIKVDGNDLTPAELGDSDQVVVGQRVIAIGNALGEFENTVTSGIISGTGRPVTASAGQAEAEVLNDLFQTDAAINPGNSGGPLVNIDGQVIGLNTAVAGDAENIGFAIPINQAKQGIASIQKTGKLEKPYMGVRFVSIDSNIANQRDLPVNEGALLVSGQSGPAVIKGSPADKAGLREGDIITEVNGEAVTKKRSLVTITSRYEVGQQVHLRVIRGQDHLEITLTLEALPN